MKKLDLNEPETQSLDLVAGNIARLRELFPEAWIEGAIDFEVLKQLLGGAVDERDEKYGLNWHGKRRARQIALTPSTGTLRPCPEESVDWDTTQNLMIEGDNLEVLKLLQKSYAGKVKLIYIDPPYNTGSDLVYPDEFRDNMGNYLQLTGQADGLAHVSSNTESGGRYHTNWLNMMYPRLMLARTLLADDGIIVVSISDVEQANLRRCLDELFGEENFIEQFIWKKSYGGGAKERYAVTQHEYCVMYAKQLVSVDALWLAPDVAVEAKYYEHTDDYVATRGPFRLKPLEATKSMGRRANLVYPIIAPDGTEIWPRRQWWWSRDRSEKVNAEGGLHFARTEAGWTVSYKQYLISEDGEKRGAKPFSIIDGIYTQRGTATIRELFDDELVFSFPKPVELISRFIEFGTRKDSIVLDFFAGSGTTGHAVMAQNALDGGTRRYLLVQLPEQLDAEDPDQATAAAACDRLGKPRTIAELTKERLRRAGARIGRDAPLVEMDSGFRVFALAPSGIPSWRPNPADLAKSLLEAIEHMESKSSDSELLFEVLLARGLDLSVKVDKRTLAGKTVFNAGGALIACLDRSITRADVESLAAGIVEWTETLSTEDPTCVFRDSAFEDDVAKTNLSSILDQHQLKNIRSF